jgi:endonuclease/exonuclease/phosphatase family metal-dependent hydrolase
MAMQRFIALSAYLLITVAITACGSADPRLEDPVFASSGRALDPSVLRVVAANLTSGAYQSYDDGHGARILHALAPDVALVQELNAADVTSFVQNTFGAGFVFMRGRGHIPNGIVSRYPLLASGEESDPVVSDRALTWALIDLPGDRDLFAVSLHLYSKDAGRRVTETTAVAALVRAHAPENAYVVVGGDFNTDSTSEACLEPLAAVVDVTAPLPADQQGNIATNATRKKPLDRLLANAALVGVETRVGELVFPSGLVVDTRVFTPLSLLPGADASDSAAANMQHMAIVRDFRLDVAPIDPPPPPPPVIEAQAIRIAAFLANEPGVDTSLEYVTIENPNDVAVSIAGYTLADRNAVRHVLSGELAPLARLTIFGKDASTGTLALSNGGDTITLANADGTVLDRVDYDATMARENVPTTVKR